MFLLDFDIEEVDQWSGLSLEVEELGTAIDDVNGELADGGVDDGDCPGIGVVSGDTVGAGDVEGDSEGAVDAGSVGNGVVVVGIAGVLVGDHDGETGVGGAVGVGVGADWGSEAFLVTWTNSWKTTVSGSGEGELLWESGVVLVGIIDGSNVCFELVVELLLEVERDVP